MATLAVRQGDILFFARSLMWMILAHNTRGLRPYRPIFEDLSRPKPIAPDPKLEPCDDGGETS